jgi:hypothetical protein
MHPHSTCRLALVAIAFSLASHLNAAETIIDEANGFVLYLPPGFEPNPALADAAPDILHGAILGDPTDEEPDIILFIEKMDGVMDRERLDPAQMPPGFRGRLFITQWQGFEVEAFEVPEQVGEVEFVTYNVQIPLVQNAIQVKLFGPGDQRAKLKVMLKGILAGLQGPSNWIPSAVPGSSTMNSGAYGMVLLGFAIVLIIGGVVALFVISRTVPKGGVLAIAVGIYFAGAATSNVRLREMMMVSGSLKFLGFVGIILGVVDLVRKRKTKIESVGSSDLVD